MQADPDGPPLSTSSHELQWEQYRPAVTSDEVIPATSYASYLPTPKSTSSPDLSRETEFVVVRMPDSIGLLNVAKTCVPLHELAIGGAVFCLPRQAL